MRNFIFAILFLGFTSLIFAQNVRIKINDGKTEFTTISTTRSGLTINQNIANVMIKDKKVKDLDFFKIEFQSFVKNQHIGEPNTPVITSLIEIPLGADVSVNITNSEEHIFNLNTYGISNMLEPVQRSISKSEDESQVEFTKNEATYNTNSFYGNDIVKVEILGIARDKRLARVTISPFQYNPVTNELKVISNISANISFNHADYSATDELKARTASPYYYSTNKFTLNNLDNNSKDVITHYPTKMVIVADPMFEAQLQTYINWKRRKGFTVIEAYTDDSNVGTTTSSIKSYLEGLYNAGTASDPAPSFVLLVGDVAQIPSFSGTTGTHKTDLYYCEYTGDFFPEIYYGRLSAQNTAQLQPQLDKTLEYEQYLMPDPSYLGDILIVAGVDANYAAINGNGQLQYGMVNYLNAAHGLSVYEYLYPLSDEAASTPAIKADFNTGVGFTNYTAHCSSEGWADPSFTTSDVPNMTNAHKYGLMISNCCQSNTFADNECWGEALLRKVNGGTVGCIGGSNVTLWGEDYHWGVGAQNIQANPPVSYDASKLGAYDKLYHENGEAQTDWFVTNAAIMVGGNFAVEQAGDSRRDYYWEIYHLMGDPSLMNYFGVPAALTVNYSDPITIGETSLTVNTEQYAYVAISQNNVLLDAQYSGANTSVVLTFPTFTSPSTADIVVTKQNRQPYIGTVQIINNSVNNDALVSDIINPETIYSCSGLTVTPQVVIRNLGQNEITSVKINYTFDGGTTITQDWTGSLASLATTTVNLADITLGVGSHTFVAFTTLPNGVADENPSNNSKTVNIDVQDNPTISDFSADVTEFCVAPIDVQFTSNSQNATSYSWDFGDGANSTDQNPSHTYTTNGFYTVKLTAINNLCGNDEEIKTNYITIDSSIPCDYCDAASSSTAYEYISNVNFNTIDNASIASGYTDFTSISTDVYLDNQYTLSVTISNDYSTDVVYAWIDWNRNGDFTDAGEYMELTLSSSVATFEITVPNTASIGTARMRIRLFDSQYDSSVGPCGDSQYGEVEDYNLNVKSSTINNIDDVNTNLFNIYPNPNNGEFMVSISSKQNVNLVKILSITGELIYSKNVNNNQFEVNISNLDKGVYFIEVIGETGTQVKRVIVK